MAFYIFPPEGYTSFNNIEFYVKRRWEFLSNIYKCNGNANMIKDLVSLENTIKDSDIFIEGCRKDSISHFIVRMITVCHENDIFEDIFFTAENALFSYRLSCMTAKEMYRATKPLRKFKKMYEKDLSCNYDDASCVTAGHNTMRNIYFLLRSFSYEWDYIIDCYFTHVELVFEIPFQFIIEFIATRLVTINNGIAFVPIRILPKLLETIFSNILKCGISLAKKKSLDFHFDSRLNHFLTLIEYPKFQYCMNGNTTFHLFKFTQIERISNYFPPCMKKLQDLLYEHHRLKHFARVRYTLFLKDAGLPLNEAIQFWKSEYSKQTSVQYADNWFNSERKYIYNIRHLYGFEGGRKNYPSHNCLTIQSADMIGSDQIGCPFKHFDDANLEQFFSESNVGNQDIEDMKAFSKKQSYNSACAIYCVHLTKNSSAQKCSRKIDEYGNGVHDSFKDDDDHHNYDSNNSLQSINSSKKRNSSRDFIIRNNENSINFNKPINFYRSYLNLIDGIS